MDFKVEGKSNRIDVQASGDLVSETCGELREAVLELAERHPELIVIDLSGVPFVDSPGLGTLIGLRSQLRRDGITLGLAKPQPRVLQLFRLTQLHRLFEIEE